MKNVKLSPGCLRTDYAVVAVLETAVQVGVGDVARATRHSRHGSSCSSVACGRRSTRWCQRVQEARTTRATQDTHHGATRTGIASTRVYNRRPSIDVNDILRLKIKFSFNSSSVLVKWFKFQFRFSFCWIKNSISNSVSVLFRIILLTVSVTSRQEYQFYFNADSCTPTFTSELF